MEIGKSLDKYNRSICKILEGYENTPKGEASNNSFSIFRARYEGKKER